MRRLGAAVAGAVLIGGQWVSTALAHDWYDKECCSGQDCAPVADGGIAETGQGYTLPNGDKMSYADKRVRQSIDNRFHWCHTGSLTWCLYVPGRGV